MPPMMAPPGPSERFSPGSSVQEVKEPELDAAKAYSEAQGHPPKGECKNRGWVSVWGGA